MIKMIGPVAYDDTMVTVNRFVQGIYTAEEAINRLRFSKANDQVTFHTEQAVKCLKLAKRYMSFCRMRNPLCGQRAQSIFWMNTIEDKTPSLHNGLPEITEEALTILAVRLVLRASLWRCFFLYCANIYYKKNVPKICTGNK